MDIKNIDHGVEIFRSCPNAILLDVRNENEYADGHIPGSINIPLGKIPIAEGVFKIQLLLVAVNFARSVARAVGAICNVFNI